MAKILNPLKKLNVNSKVSTLILEIQGEQFLIIYIVQTYIIGFDCCFNFIRVRSLRKDDITINGSDVFIIELIRAKTSNETVQMRIPLDGYDPTIMKRFVFQTVLPYPGNKNKEIREQRGIK